MEINMKPPVKVFEAVDEGDKDPTMWDIVWVDGTNTYTFTQKVSGRVVVDSMAAWKHMLKGE